MPPSPALDPEELLAQVGWVRSLALQVARDPEVADDLAQDAFRVALSDTAGPPRSLRRWLAAVVRNLGRTRRRGEDRRARREVASAPPETSPSTLELLERAATQRALVGTLLELDEPYRSTLLQRFFEERSAREIAARTGLPESTVATRTAEGLRRLRARLARRGGGPRAWLPSILPLLRWPRAATTGAVAVTIQQKLALGGGLVVAALLAYVAVDASGPSVAGRADSVDDAAEALVAPEPLPEEDLVGGANEASRTPAGAAPAARAAIPTVPRTYRGRVIDLDGLPVGGVDVCRIGFAPPAHPHHGAVVVATEAEECTTSGADGTFAIAGRPPFQLEVRDDRYATLLQGHVYPQAEHREPVIVVTWRIPLGGVVVDELGNGVPEATVYVRLARRPVQLEGNLFAASTWVVPEVRTDERGAFDFPAAAGIEGALLQVQAAGFAPASLPIPAGGGEHLRVVLSRSHLGTYAVAGRVLLPDGTPAAGALVSIGWRSVPVDDEGAFVLDVEEALSILDREEPQELRAGLGGFRPATLTLPSLAEAEESGWPADVELVLGGPPLAIRGRVVDERGNPLAGWLVDTPDAERFGLVPIGRGDWMTRRTFEELAGGGETSTGLGGEFALTGLRARDYRVRVWGRLSLLSVETDPLAAGNADVEIVVDRGGLGRIAGRVVDREGEGIAGVRVAVSGRRSASLAIGRSTVTDGQGRFALEQVATTPPFLRLEGAPIVPELFRTLDPDDDVEDLELRVGRRCDLQVDWTGWQGRADELRVVAAGDAPLEVVALEGGGVTPQTAIGVSEGLSEVFAVSDAATEAVLLLDGREVARIPLRLRPGELELLRP